MRRLPTAQVAGFTLIEAMIVVAVVALLTAIALPSYTEYVKRARRAAAKTQVLQTAQWLERYRTANNTYAGAAAQLPLSFTQSPAPGNGTAQYTTAITQPIGGAIDTTYLVEAVPVAGGPMDGDACGTLAIDQTGLQQVFLGGVAQPSSTVAMCWSR